MLGKIVSRESREKRHFNALAKGYEVRYGYKDKFTEYKIAKKVKQFIGLVRSAYGGKKITVLEIGCGTGAYTLEIAPKLPKARILAIDISNEMVKIAKRKRKKNNNIHFRVSSAYRTKFKDESIDVVCGFYVLHHLDFKAVKKEIYRVLKPGGLVYFYEPNILNPVVLVIKSSKFLKKIIGDSVDEWAVNPLKTKLRWDEFEVIESKTSEFIWPFSFIPFKSKKFLDELTTAVFSKTPGINLLGGSVRICLKKQVNFNEK